jgi:hypothetical protein
MIPDGSIIMNVYIILHLSSISCSTMALRLSAQQ